VQLQLSLAVADKLHEALLVRGEPLYALEAARMLLASPTAPEPICREVLATLIQHDQRFCLGTVDAGYVSLRHWERPDPDLADVPFVALDLETTGSRPGAGKITEIGAVRLEGFREVAHFHTLVNPRRPIPPMITRITGITQEMVAGAPRIEEVIPELLEFLEGAVVVAHNAGFDVGFLNYELMRLKGRRLGDGAFDTLPLARILAPGLPNYRLATVAEALGAPVAACHRALADAQAAGHVFVTLVGRLQERGITRLGQARAYVSPSARPAVEKLRLTRDIPRSPGTYRFLDKHGAVLYVGKADRLRERVRSYFVAGAGHTRRVRQAIRLVEHIDWDETPTPLEAVVREQQQILEHRPPCNLYGCRPENYAYIKMGGSGPGLNLYLSTRPPAWLAGPEAGPRPSRGPAVIGPFRGHARLRATLDLLQRCYPIRRCPRRPDGRPCVRFDRGGCLAPCTGDPGARLAHDDLVRRLASWLTGETHPDLPDPVGRADDLVRSLSRQRRFEEAQAVREACEHMLSVRRSYSSLAEAAGLRFAALWHAEGPAPTPAVRLNLVWDGRLQTALWLCDRSYRQEIEDALQALWARDKPDRPGGAACSPVAVPQKELDALLAVRRWAQEGDHACMVPLPGPGSSTLERLQARDRLVAATARLLAGGETAGYSTDRAAEAASTGS
jgi:DNA polymerase-3 subunit epsilon